MTCRTLHLIEPRCTDWPALAAAGAFLRDASAADGEHLGVIVGSPSCARRADEAGVPSLGRLGPALGQPALARRALDRLRSRLGHFEAVHSWSPGAMALASMLSGWARSATIAQMPPRASTVLRRRLWRRVFAQTHRVLFASGTVRGAWHALGAHAPGEQVLPVPLVLPGCESDDRERVRASWGVEPGRSVILACGTPPSSIDARWFCYQTGVLTVAGRPAMLVLPLGCAQDERALRFAERHTHAWSVRFDKRPFWRLAAGADVALWATPGVSHGLREGASTPMPPDDLAWALATGLPGVAEDHPAAREAMRGIEGVRWVSPTRATAYLDALWQTIDRGRPASAGLSVPPHRRLEPWCEAVRSALRLASCRVAPLVPA